MGMMSLAQESRYNSGDNLAQQDRRFARYGPGRSRWSR